MGLITRTVSGLVPAAPTTRPRTRPVRISDFGAPTRAAHREESARMSLSGASPQYRDYRLWSDGPRVGRLRPSVRVTFSGKTRRRRSPASRRSWPQHRDPGRCCRHSHHLPIGDRAGPAQPKLAGGRVGRRGPRCRDLPTRQARRGRVRARASRWRRRLGGLATGRARRWSVHGSCEAAHASVSAGDGRRFSSRRGADRSAQTSRG